MKAPLIIELFTLSLTFVVSADDWVLELLLQVSSQLVEIRCYGW